MLVAATRIVRISNDCHQLRRSCHAFLRPLCVALALAIPLSASAQDVLRIGAPLPLTGGLSPEGTKLRQGYELWQEQVNAAGGIKAGDKQLKVELAFHDYQSATPKAVQLAEKLITDDKVDFVFSPFGSGAAKAVSAVAEKYAVPLLASTASSPCFPRCALHRAFYRPIRRKTACSSSGSWLGTK